MDLQDLELRALNQQANLEKQLRELSEQHSRMVALALLVRWALDLRAGLCRALAEARKNPKRCP